MDEYEKLGSFYLGRLYDLAKKKPTDGLLLYDSKDLVTHAVCVGMTGSGKTGLCLALLEEAALDGIPAILIDPKGDLPNLLLTFPNLQAGDFQPWVSEEEARRKDLSVEQFAAQQAELWKTGLQEWGQTGERIRRLREAAEFVVYTPGSSTGLPVSILRSFAAPETAVLEDGELLQDRVGTTVMSLLSLVGIQADPVQSREHILLSTILGWAWQSKENLTLEAIVRYVQDPPMGKIGVLDLESFYPAKERFGLVMALNNLLAAPGFAAWMEGEDLDIGQLLHTVNGKPRHCIFSIAHLNDAERMFFVSLLLTQVLGWTRSQPGTASLRAVLYMDEIFGYFPPVANPPSKAPLLSLLKQARAYGLGVVLATQNPVDLDYKGLSNAGTWFIGRLQTERDKARLMEGLEGAAAAESPSFDRREMEETLAGLGQRVFLMNNVHEDEPAVFQSRWAMSYLRGPMTGAQIKVLMDPMKGKGTAARAHQPPAAEPSGAAATLAAEAGHAAAAPTVAADVPQFYAPPPGGGPAGGTLLYHPVLVGAARLHYTEAKAGVDVTQELAFTTPIHDAAIPVRWEEATAAGFSPRDLQKSPATGAGFIELPAPAAKPKSYAAWEKEFAGWLYSAQRLTLFKSPSLGEISRPGESERDFRVRLQQAAREQRDQAVDRLRQKYAPRIGSLQERIRRAQQALQREQEQVKDQKMQTAISFGATLLGAAFGRKALSSTTLGRATTAARGVSRTMRQQEDVGRVVETVETLQQQLAALEEEFRLETEGLESKLDPQREELENLNVAPKKSGISVQLVALVWEPRWSGGGSRDEMD
jgi:hypothetical protein